MHTDRCRLECGHLTNVDPDKGIAWCPACGALMPFRDTTDN